MPRTVALPAQLLALLHARREGHGRQLASELQASPATTARTLARMQRSGLLSSRQVGRTRLYRPAVNTSLVQQALDCLAAVPLIHPLAILPFGSRVLGAPGPDSDLDLLVVVPDAEATSANWQRLRQSLAGLDVPIDLLLYSATEARRWALVPANPVSEALRANPRINPQEFAL